MLPTSPELWVVGDVHGALTKLKRLLWQAGLTNPQGQWQGGKAHVVFLGDYIDRGEDGVGTVRLIRTLQRQAHSTGGRVDALLGNHEAMLLAALRFAARDPQDNLKFFQFWTRNGGDTQELACFEPSDLAWMRRCPAMLRVGPWLLQHADSLMYLHYGQRVGDVNAAVAELLQSDDPESWHNLLALFTTRMAFQGEKGQYKAQQLLDTYQATRLVHGHTPVGSMFKWPPSMPSAPQWYAGKLCLNVDSGMTYTLGGFIVRLSVQEIAQVVSLDEW